MARIAVIGAGHIGGTLGDTWRRAGHQVTFDRAFAPGRRVDGVAHRGEEVGVHDSVDGVQHGRRSPGTIMEAEAPANAVIGSGGSSELQGTGGPSVG